MRAIRIQAASELCPTKVLYSAASVKKCAANAADPVITESCNRWYRHTSPRTKGRDESLAYDKPWDEPSLFRSSGEVCDWKKSIPTTRSPRVRFIARRLTRETMEFARHTAAGLFIVRFETSAEKGISDSRLARAIERSRGFPAQLGEQLLLHRIAWKFRSVRATSQTPCRPACLPGYASANFRWRDQGHSSGFLLPS